MATIQTRTREDLGSFVDDVTSVLVGVHGDMKSLTRQQADHESRVDARMAGTDQRFEKALKQARERMDKALVQAHARFKSALEAEQNKGERLRATVSEEVAAKNKALLETLRQAHADLRDETDEAFAAFKQEVASDVGDLRGDVQRLAGALEDAGGRMEAETASYEGTLRAALQEMENRIDQGLDRIRDEAEARDAEFQRELGADLTSQRDRTLDVVSRLDGLTTDQQAIQLDLQARGQDVQRLRGMQWLPWTGLVVSVAALGVAVASVAGYL